QEKTWIYSLINESINKHNKLSEAWDPILFKVKQQIQRKLQLLQQQQQQRQQPSTNKN
ncbi:unnamed protein product, partial [Rotaria socialis]